MLPQSMLEVEGVPGGSEARDSMRRLQDLSRALASAVEELQEPQPSNAAGVFDFYEEVRRFEIGLIERALAVAGGQQRRAAHLLRMKPTTLNAKIKQYGIECRAARAVGGPVEAQDRGLDELAL